MNIIETIDLSKSFGSVQAVNGVSINVRKGEIYGFLGLNGAGKTTAIRLLLGMIKPDKGKIMLFGKPVKQASPVWNNVGYMVENPYAYPELTVRENLEIFYRLRGLKDSLLIDRIIEKLQLGNYRERKAKHLSLGNRQRLGLAKALMHRPELLILDEPINGMDPAGIVEIREFLLELSENHGTTIFLSSHILTEISRLATRIGIVHQGRLIREINSRELEGQLIRKLRIDTLNNPEALKLLCEKGYDVWHEGPGKIETADIRAIERPEEVTLLLSQCGLPPRMLIVFEEDLESYFLRIIGKGKEL